MIPKKAKPKKKKGAQPGNKNAERHGFYSKSFTPDQNKRLDGQKELDVESEINLLSIHIDNLQKEISYDEITRLDNNASLYRDSHYLNQLNTLSAMAQARSTLVRTQYLIKGKSGDIQSSILQALEELRLEMGI